MAKSRISQYCNFNSIVKTCKDFFTGCTFSSKYQAKMDSDSTTMHFTESNNIHIHSWNFQMCAILLEVLMPLNQTFRIRIYKNIARPRFFVEKPKGIFGAISPIYYIIRCSRMWRHSHCPSPPSFFLFRHFDSKNCNLTNVNTNIKTSANLPYLFITACFGSYRSREGVMGASPHPTFSCARPLFPFVLSLKSFVVPLLSYDS